MLGRTKRDEFDLLVVGGGINGAAIAREAALHGLSVLLVERDDLANHTSSASTKLIHGGLRYLEYYEFRLVREALRERGLLLVGIDVIHGKLTEINVTAPTGVRAIKKLGGPDLAAQLFDVIESKVAARG